MIEGGRTLLALEIVEASGHPEILEYRLRYEDVDFWKVVVALGSLVRAMTEGVVSGWIVRPDKPFNRLYSGETK